MSNFPEFESRGDSLGDLANPDSWPRRVNALESTLKTNESGDYLQKKHWFRNALGSSNLDGGSDRWKEITSAATAQHNVAEQYILGLPVRLSSLIDTHATGKACGRYKLANRGAMDGTAIGTT